MIRYLLSLMVFLFMANVAFARPAPKEAPETALKQQETVKVPIWNEKGIDNLFETMENLKGNNTASPTNIVNKLILETFDRKMPLILGACEVQTNLQLVKMAYSFSRYAQGAKEFAGVGEDVLDFSAKMVQKNVKDLPGLTPSCVRELHSFSFSVMRILKGENWAKE
jgi:hypothetical protein